MHSVKTKTVYKFLQALEERGDEMVSGILDDMLSLSPDHFSKSSYILMIVSQHYRISTKFYLHTKHLTAPESEAKKIAVYLLLNHTNLSALDVADMFNYKHRDTVYQIKRVIEGLDKRIPADRAMIENIEFLSNRIKTKYGQEKEHGNT